MAKGSMSPPQHAADRLNAAIHGKRAPVCVGIDPVLERLPAVLKPKRPNDPYFAAEALAEFAAKVVDAVAPHVPCIKFQAACFERYLTCGWARMVDLINGATQVQVILDAKRGDIGLTAEHYAEGLLGDSTPERPLKCADWITVNSYLGEDGISPFLRTGHGAFALVRTSNPGGDDIQALSLGKGKTVAHAVAELVARIGGGYVGESGYSSLGAVVGATKSQEAERLRQLMPEQMFLVPGFGAQGGSVDDVLPCFKSDGTGAIVTASRSVIYAFEVDDPKWDQAVSDAAAQFADEVGRAVGMRH